MISRVSGNIEEIGVNYLIIDVGGLGYKVYTTSDTLHVKKIGAPIKLFTHHVVREDAEDLYGFAKKSDMIFFEHLISVSGIGPKSALNILSLAPSNILIESIRTGSTSHLTKISGIGKKTAEKIVLELQDKLGKMTVDGEAIGGESLSSDLDAVEALRALGYDAQESRDALKSVSKEITDVGAKVKAALKFLS